MQIIKGQTPGAWIIKIYGVPGVGKSSLANFAPKPFFLNIEDGLDRINCERSPHLKTWAEFIKAMKWASTSEYKTIAIDTITGIEEMLIKQMLEEVNQKREPGYFVNNINDKDAFPYGAGGQLLKSKWLFVLKLIYRLKEKGKNVIVIAHESIQRVSNPEGEDYDRYTPNIHKKSVDHVISQLDGVFFVHYERLYRTKQSGMGKEVRYMQDTGNRLVQTMEKLTALAKNRFGLASVLPLNNEDDCRAFFNAIK